MLLDLVLVNSPHELFVLTCVVSDSSLPSSSPSSQPALLEAKNKWES